MKRKTLKYKSIVMLILMFVLSTSFSVADTGESPYQFVRVGLNYTSAASSSAQITSQESLAIWDFLGEDSFMPLEGIDKINITIENNEMHVRDDQQQELYYDSGGEQRRVSDALANGFSFVSSKYTNYLHGESDGTDAVLLYNGKPYRGGMGFFPNANNTIRPINQLTIDEYTYGVINGEMGYSNPIEALKAQAVVARSFGLTNIGRHSSNNFDLCDSTHCQVYKGFSDEYDKTTQAVNETAQLGIYYEGKPVSAYYSKNSGGYTQNSEDVWNAKVGYLRAIKDEYSPLYSWKATFTLSELESKLRAAGYSVGTLKGVSVTERNESGSVATLEFTGSTGNATLQKEKIRTVLGMTTVKSTRFNLITENQATSTNVHLKGSSANQPSSQEIYILNSAGVKEKIRVASVYVAYGSSVERLLPNQDTTITGNSVTFEGTGSGHGIGLPQDSAIEMAKSGFDYREILNYYYTDIEIK